ncbi:hypothetical protein [uncultured Sporomusa sp.]|nr:hypothetical protein [uncultured Sporomusa sp.]
MFNKEGNGGSYGFMPVGTVELTFTGGIDGGYTAWVSHTLPNIGFAGFF